MQFLGFDRSFRVHSLAKWYSKGWGFRVWGWVEALKLKLRGGGGGAGGFRA